MSPTHQINVRNNHMVGDMTPGGAPRGRQESIYVPKFLPEAATE
jgi:hypothetical protein